MRSAKVARRPLLAAAAVLIVGVAVFAAREVSGQITPPPDPEFVKVPHGYTNMTAADCVVQAGAPSCAVQMENFAGWMRFMPGDDMSCAQSWGAHACVPGSDRPGSARVERWTTAAGEYCQQQHRPDGSRSRAFCWVPTRSPADPLTPIYDPLVIVGVCSPQQEAEITVIWRATWQAFDDYNDAVAAGTQVADPALRSQLFAAFADADNAFTECLNSRNP